MSGIIASSNKRLHSIASVYIVNLKSLGYTVTNTEKNALNNLAKNLVGRGAQNSTINFISSGDVAQFAPLIGNSKVCCEVDLLLQPISFVGANWTFNATGAVSTGAAGNYIRTGYTPTGLGSNAGFGMYNRSFAGGWMIGGRASSPFFAMESVNSANLGCLFNAGATISESRSGVKNLIGGRVDDNNIVRPATGAVLASAKAGPGTDEILIATLTTGSGAHAADLGYFMLNRNMTEAKRTILKSITDQFILDMGRA